MNISKKKQKRRQENMYFAETLGFSQIVNEQIEKMTDKEREELRKKAKEIAETA